MEATLQLMLCVMVIGFNWGSLALIQRSVSQWQTALDHGASFSLRWPGTFASFRDHMEATGSDSVTSIGGTPLPPRSDHQRDHDPLLCEIATSVDATCANVDWSCP